MKQFNKEFLKDTWELIKPYWQSEEKKIAWFLLIIIIFLNLFLVFINVLINLWYNEFYNALQDLNAKAFWIAIIQFCVLAFLYIIAAVYSLYLNQMLQIKWRKWLTDRFLKKWLNKKIYYHLQVFNNSTDNPDQRISEDLNLFVSQTLSLSLGLLSSVVTLASFVGILWTISGSISFEIFGNEIIIPGYMVWAAILYAILGTWITAAIGKPLINLNFKQQMYEANFRFNMVRIRENSESVALYGGEKNEHKHLMVNFFDVFENYWKIMVRQKMLGWFTSGYNQIAIIFPILVASPRFFAREIQLGALMQIAQAFGQVQSSLSYIVNSYPSLANWHAVADRLRTFEHNISFIEDLQQKNNRIIIKESENLMVENLSIFLPDNKTPLINQLNLSLNKSERLLVVGSSGIGKSTLIRTLAGLWPFGEGKIFLPPKEKLLFLPQKPYLPIGSLKDVLIYPNGDPDVSDDEIKDLLISLNLKHLVNHISEVNMWSQILSLGEQQYLAFGRILLQRPEWIFMDEATSALDEKSERILYFRLKDELSNSAVISVGHRSSLLSYHEKKLIILGEGKWSIDRIGYVNLEKSLINE
ncbi:putative ATP-binding cassette transporter [Thermodesulfobium acidiphilum]|uniref:Putative ATP-binding cassette transporter n=1 Tax=Thermodesulfobium acidiphilum TaxID=1794699 RepID=A0A2R4W193_THEAF|nr:ABC transporter ATP-binding protein/permease [Thermodesulfobium acidiphilum]AWB10581.1 putative ATP-binding cassette transporter [Thermodesulfobium acidiphilum]